MIAQWQRSLRRTRDASTGQDLIHLEGAASVQQPQEEFTLAGDSIELWLDANAETKAQAPAPPASGVMPAFASNRMEPSRLVATTRVQLASPDLRADTNRLDVTFVALGEATPAYALQPPAGLPEAGQPGPAQQPQPPQPQLPQQPQRPQQPPVEGPVTRRSTTTREQLALGPKALFPSTPRGMGAELPVHSVAVQPAAIPQQPVKQQPVKQQPVKQQVVKQQVVKQQVVKLSRGNLMLVSWNVPNGSGGPPPAPPAEAENPAGEQSDRVVSGPIGNSAVVPLIPMPVEHSTAPGPPVAPVGSPPASATPASASPASASPASASPANNASNKKEPLELISDVINVVVERRPRASAAEAAATAAKPATSASSFGSSSSNSHVREVHTFGKGVGSPEAARCRGSAADQGRSA